MIRRMRDTMENFREPTRREVEVLGMLLGREFPGAAALRLQLPGLEVAPIDADGSLSLRPRSDAESATVTTRVPVEGRYRDHDGASVYVLLHVVHGRLHELELFRGDGETVMRPLEEAEDFDPEAW